MATNEVGGATINPASKAIKRSEARARQKSEAQQSKPSDRIQNMTLFRQQVCDSIDPSQG
jgi:hypothetical protein